MNKLYVKSVVCYLMFLLQVCAVGVAGATGDKGTYREYQRQVPVVLAKETVVSKIKIEGQQGKRLQEVVLLLEALPVAEKMMVSVYAAQSDGEFRNTPPKEWSLLTSGEVETNVAATFETDVLLEDEESYFYISCTLPSTWKLEDQFSISTAGTRIGKTAYQPKMDEQLTFYPAVAVRQHNQDGVHTSRIPGLARTNKGTLLAIFDARYESARDLQGHMDIGLHRSEDGGQTWEPMQIAMDMGEWGGLPQKFNGVSDACILVDQVSGTIFIAGTWMYGLLDDDGKWIENLQDTSTLWNHQWRKKGSQSGFDVKQTAQFLVVKSTDDGKTWSDPVNITKMGKQEEWWLWAPAPGNGITLKDGTLVFPTQGRDHTGKPFSNITYSKDRGKTWIASPQAIDVEGGTTECAVVELSNGNLMLNMRANKNKGNSGPDNGRAVSVSSDLGQTWNEHPTSFRDLTEPTCMASLFRHDISVGNQKTPVLYHVNPDDHAKRINITLKASLDEGTTWPKTNHMLLDIGSSRAYSSITSVDQEYIGILYESSQADMVFQKIAVKDVLKKEKVKSGKAKVKRQK